MPDLREPIPIAPAPPPPPRPRWTTGKAVLFTLALALAVRLIALGSLPLLVTEDGVDYLLTGESIARWTHTLSSTDWPDIPPVRTPGYQVFIGLCLAFFGQSPIGILVVQHLMGVGIAVAVAWASGRIAGARVGPWLATIVGALVALDPWLIASESFLLTEAATAFFVTLGAACALAFPRPSFLRGLAVGALVACAIHIRPACQVLVPFLVGGTMLAGFTGLRRWRDAFKPALLCGLGAALALAVILGPWLWFNFAKRDVRGMARGFDTQLWIYFWKEGVVDDQDMPPEFREPFEKAGLDKILAQEKRAYEFIPFISDIDAWGNAENGKKLGTWAKAAAKRNSVKYQDRFTKALLIQLNNHTDQGNVLDEELPGFVYCLGRGWGPESTPERQAITKNFHTYKEPEALAAYRMPTDAGLPGQAIRWYAKHHPKGVPYVGLFVIAGVACLIALARGRWTILLVFVGVLASILLHAALLAFFARYAVPYWMVLYLAPAALASVSLPRGGRAGEGLERPPELVAAAPRLEPRPANKRPI